MSIFDEDREWEAMEEAAEERYIESLFEHFLDEHGPDIRADAIGDFTRERLQSLYFDDPDLAKPAFRQLKEARSLLPGHPSAALVMAGSALEVGLKAVLLRPIVHGLVHQDWLADAIADLSVSHNGWDRFKKLLPPIVASYSKLDMMTYKRPKASDSLWAEVQQVQKNRNGVVHGGEVGTSEQADQAIGVAAAILEEILPVVLTSIGMKLEGDEIVEQT